MAILATRMGRRAPFCIMRACPKNAERTLGFSPPRGGGCTDSTAPDDKSAQGGLAIFQMAPSIPEETLIALNRLLQFLNDIAVRLIFRSESPQNGSELPVCILDGSICGLLRRGFRAESWSLESDGSHSN
jgi:hypothetical protein